MLGAESLLFTFWQDVSVGNRGGIVCCILGHFMKFTANWWWYYLIHKFKSGIKRSPAVLGTFCWRELNLINMNKTQLPDKLCPIYKVSQPSVLQNHCRNTAVTLIEYNLTLSPASGNTLVEWPQASQNDAQDDMKTPQSSCSLKYFINYLTHASFPARAKLRADNSRVVFYCNHYYPSIIVPPP